MEILPHQPGQLLGGSVVSFTPARVYRWASKELRIGPPEWYAAPLGAAEAVVFVPVEEVDGVERVIGLMPDVCFAGLGSLSLTARGEPFSSVWRAW